MNNQQKCPVCEGAATRSTPPFLGEVGTVPMSLSVSCNECDEFSMEEGFLDHVLNTISAEDKHAITAYLKATKGKSGCVREITSKSWRHIVSQGRKLLQARPSA